MCGKPFSRTALAVDVQLDEMCAWFQQLSILIPNSAMKPVLGKSPSEKSFNQSIPLADIPYRKSLTGDSESTEFSEELRFPSQLIAKVPERRVLDVPIDATAMDLWKELQSSQKNIIYDENVKTEPRPIETASINRLIEQLTPVLDLDVKFMHAFMLTYRVFITPDNLWSKLVERFNAPSSIELSKRKIIQSRVLNVIKFWTSRYKDELEVALKESMMTFINGLPDDQDQTIKQSIKNNLNPDKDSKVHKDYRSQSQMSLGLVMDIKKFMELDTELIAKQLTMLESRLFRAVQAVEFLNNSWSKQDKQWSPNLLNTVKRFNEFGLWVGTMILTPKKAKTRGQRMEKFILLAQKLKELGNFQTMMAIVSSLNNAALLRLKWSWGFVSKSSRQTFLGLEEIMSSAGSFKEYRAALKAAQPPIVPFIGLTLSDLTFAEEGNPDFIEQKGKKFVNFGKQRIIHKIISDLLLFQDLGYKFDLEESVQAFLLEQFQFINDEALYSLSLQREPRGATKSQIQ